MVGLSLPVAMAALAADLPETETLRLAKHYPTRVIAGRQDGDDTAPLFPGALAASSGWRRGRRRCSGSRPARRGAGSTISSRMHGLGGSFTTLQTADLHPSKPHPSMLLAALAETGCAAGRR